MKNIIIDILAKVGAWCCQKAIKLANSGHIDFEVSIPHKQPFLVHVDKKPRRKIRLGLVVLSMVAISLTIWSVLTLSFSVENSCDKLIYELQREHKEEMQNFVFKRTSLR